MSSGTFVDRIDPFAKRSLKKKPKKSQGSSRYRNSADVELQVLPMLKGLPVLTRSRNSKWRLPLQHETFYTDIVFTPFTAHSITLFVFSEI
ncbi:hypothetical protein J437_LFUL009311 [Ladona fulva]|uniref:Uncharacterized protein n=1 Tax=Ladona fulva TaxID=123851 RepID=A0A8K0P068_LADFU|nr:hypothetical protein J437_LFUL009311 [Ladona fulva]